MVGLPARGKTFIARKVARYLSWLGHRTRVFNVGAYRRERIGAHQHHTFFAADNEPAGAARLAVALAALDDMLAWLEAGGEVGIYDATNTTPERRARVRERCRAAGHEVVFLESICDDPAILESNIRLTKARSPDYAGVGEEDAVRDFRLRIQHYAGVYTEVGEHEGSFIKIIDAGRKLVAHRIVGYLPARLVHLLVNFHLEPRAIFLTRHGESEFNVHGRIGGDAPLTERGRSYADALASYVRERRGPKLVVWTSTLRRTIETAEPLGMPFSRLRALDEIDAGVCDGMTYDEVARAMPAEYAARKADKFRYRYPRGESYEDVIQRLEPVIFELERERSPVLVIGHQAVLRALYAYLMEHPPDACPNLALPLHTLVRITPTAYGSEETRIALEPRGSEPPVSS